MMYYTTNEGGIWRRLRLGISEGKMKKLLAAHFLANYIVGKDIHRGERVCTIRKGWRMVRAHAIRFSSGMTWDVVAGFRHGLWPAPSGRWHPCNCQHLSRYEMKISPTCPSHSEWLKPATRRPAHG